MTDYNSYPTILQSSQSEYVSSDVMTANSNQMSNSANNNIIYNSSPLIVLNSQKQDMALIQNSMINDGQTYLTIQTQPSNGTSDLNGAKLLNTPIIIQSSQTSQYQQSQQQQQQQATTINVQQNATQMTSLTPSQLQSLSYLMQTQMAPQFIQTSNGLLQIIPQSFVTTQQQSNQGQGHDQTIQSQLTGLPTIGWSLGNFNANNNPITLDNQLQPLQMNNLNLSQLIPLQHVIQSSNSFFTNQNEDQEQMVSTIVDLNASDKKSLNGSGPQRKPSRRKRKQTTKLSLSDSSQIALPTSTNGVQLEAAESSNLMSESITQYDNKGRPFSFLCPDCPKKFTLNSRLSAHMRCHTGMRPFTCTVCGFSFTQKSYLIRHAAVHKEERPFHCEKCLKSYKHYGSLANHRKLHRKEDKDLCDGDQVKMEPIASDNARSMVMNNCGEFQGNMMAMCREEMEEEEQHHQEEDEGEVDENRERIVKSENMFTITSTTGTNDNDNGHYLKQMAMIFPMSAMDDPSGKSMNIFFQEPLPPIPQQQPQDIDESYEDDYEDGDEEEGEAHCEDMVDISVNDGHNLVSSVSYDGATISNDYNRH